MLLAGDLDDDQARSHSPFKGVAGKQTFFEQPDNEKEYSQDDMSLKNQRNYDNFHFDEEPYVPVAVAQKHISLMEADMRRMKDNYGKTMKDLEAGYIRLEEKTRDIYKRTLGAWRGKAKTKIRQFQDALKKSIDERNEIETNLKERLRKQRIEKERLEKEKAFLLSENQVGKEQIQEKARLLDEIKASYTHEITDKEQVIDQREEQINKLKDEHDQEKIKFEQEKEELAEEHKNEISEIKKQLDDEITKKEELEEKLHDMESQLAAAMVAVPIARQSTTKLVDHKAANQKNMFDDNDSDNSDIQSLTEVKKAKGESKTLVNIVPVAAAYTGDSYETKELLERIDALEKDKAQMQEDKIDLAKAVTNLNELLKESRSQLKIQQTQINDAERQGAEILPVEVAEERTKVALKKTKTLKKKKTRIRDAEVEEEEDDVFKDDKELKKMVENLVPEEQREDAVAEAKAAMLVHNSKNEDLEKIIKNISKENDMLKKSLQELKRRGEDSDGATLDTLQEENRALINQIKNLKKQNAEVERSNSQMQQRLPTVNENHDEDGSDVEVNHGDGSLAVGAAVVNAGPCKN